MRLLPALFAVFALSTGCATFPDIEATESQASRDAGYPSLAPLDSLLAAGTAERVTQSEIDSLTARAARLRVRAETLRHRND